MTTTAREILAQLPAKDGDPDPNGAHRGTPRGGKKKAGEQAAQLAEGLEVWLDPDSNPWVTLVFADHREHWPVRSSTVRRHLTAAFFAAWGTGISANALRDVVNLLEGRAQHEAQRHPVGLRVVEHDGVVYLDLCDSMWRAVKITASGWIVVDDPPVRFRRAPGMRELPLPLAGGDLFTDLRPLLNVDDDGWVLVVGWLVMSMRPRGPYPLLELRGEQGSAKTTLATLLRSIVDPSKAPMRSAPKEDRDLVISATNSWICGFDNLSKVDGWLSDALCRLSTGGGLSTRRLYTDDEEALFDVQRPVIITGIDRVAVRGDLADRAVSVELAQISDAERKLDATVSATFRKRHPRILGAVLDAVSSALANFDAVEMPHLPRMADFATWVTAAEEALGWEDGSFVKTYKRSIAAANDAVLESSPITAKLLA